MSLNKHPIKIYKDRNINYTFLTVSVHVSKSLMYIIIHTNDNLLHAQVDEARVLPNLTLTLTGFVTALDNGGGEHGGQRGP